MNLGQESLDNHVMLVNVAYKLGKILFEKAMHGVFVVWHELRQGPKGLLLVGQVHEQESGDCGHTLAVADLSVVNRVGGEYVVKLDLALVVALLVGDIVAESAVDVKVDLTQVDWVESGQAAHFLVHATLSFDLCVDVQEL